MNESHVYTDAPFEADDRAAFVAAYVASDNEWERLVLLAEALLYSLTHPGEPSLLAEMRTAVASRPVEPVVSRPLAGVEAMEAGLFRAGAVARRLVAHHPHLPVVEMRPETIDDQFVLVIHAGSEEAVHAWATALGSTVNVTVDSVRPAYRRAMTSVRIDGLLVTVRHGQFLPVPGYPALVGDDQ